MLPRRNVLRLGAAALAGAALPLSPSAAADLRPRPTFPLRAAADGHYLVDARNVPFLIVGDSPQAIYQQLTPEEVDTYLAFRQAQGFSALLCDPAYSNNNDGHVRPARNGHFPFLRDIHGGNWDGTSGAADFSTPDPAYWDNVAQVMAKAEARGFVVLHYVLAWGYGGKTMWLDLINRRNTIEVCRAFGEFLGRRFRDQANVIWIDGSDYNGDTRPRAPDGSSGIARALAIAEGMQAAGARQLRTGDWMADSLSTDQTPFAPLMTVNGVYAYGDKVGFNATYVQAHRAYLHQPPLPAFLKESGYEAEKMIPGDPASVRKYEWWCLLSGATAGVIYGNGDIWPFPAGRWQAALRMPGGADMARLGAFMRGLDWYALVPSELAGMRRLVISPNGGATPTRPDYVAAAQTQDGRTLVAYVPPFRSGTQSLTLDLAGMAGESEATWWDPTSAQTHPAGRFARGTRPELTTPGRNVAGANDWVLLLRSAE